MPDAVKSDERTSNVCYVYLLLKTPITEPPVIGGFDLANVLYVGKGTGYRWREHFHDALKAVDSPKAAAIREALGADPTSEVIERHALVVAGHLSEIEAYRMEAVMLHLVGGPRAVTNIVAGRRAPELMVPAHDARVFFGAQDLAVDAWNVGSASSSGRTSSPNAPATWRWLCQTRGMTARSSATCGRSTRRASGRTTPTRSSGFRWASPSAIIPGWGNGSLIEPQVEAS